MPDRLSFPDARNFFIGIVETMSYLADAYKMKPFVIVGQPGALKDIEAERGERSGIASQRSPR